MRHFFVKKEKKKIKKKTVKLQNYNRIPHANLTLTVVALLSKSHVCTNSATSVVNRRKTDIRTHEYAICDKELSTLYKQAFAHLRAFNFHT